METVQTAPIEIEPDLRENIEIENLSQQVDTFACGYCRLLVLDKERFLEIVVESLSAMLVDYVARADIGGFAIRQKMKVGRPVVGFQVKIDVVGGRGKEERKIAREMLDHSLVRATDFHDVTVKVENTGRHWSRAFPDWGGWSFQHLLLPFDLKRSAECDRKS